MSNFEILNDRWPELYKLGSEAESYVYSDPQSCLIKLRCFIELIVENIYRDINLDMEKNWTLLDKLRNKNFSILISKLIMDKFHAIRIKGNNAAHSSNSIDTSVSIWILEESFQVSCWVYKSYYRDKNFDCKEFVKPIDNGDRLNCLNRTIIELEQTLEIEKKKNREIIDISTDDILKKSNDFKSKNNEAADVMRLNSDKIKKRITLSDIFSDYNLTHSQSESINELDKFLNNKNQNIFLLKGYAGTGKTFLTKGLTEFLTSLGLSYTLAAPTGKAAKVIREKTKDKAFTIHKTIYSYKDLKEYKVENLDGTETFKFYFELNQNGIHNSNHVYIIDEASMISNNYQEGEFFRFGSGKLLSDLFEFIKINHNDHNKKIIFIGDTAQLPPVGMSFSPALDSDFLKSKFSLEVVSSELRDVVRQDKKSGILENSTNIRNSIKQSVFNKIDINLESDDINHINHENLLSEYLESCDYKINGESIIIAHSNSIVDEYNFIVRNHFFPNQKHLVSGDKVMAVTNNGNMPIFIYNGDFGLIKSVNSEVIRREVFVREKIDNNLITTKVPLQFRKVEIGFKNSEDEKSYYFETLVFENILYRDIVYSGSSFESNISQYNLKDREISRFETIALYVDFVERAKKLGLKPNTNEFKLAIKNDQFFNCLKIKFGYAITCHKAQGSEWNNVFVNCKTHQSVLSKDYFRWLYTAMTRASKRLYMIDEPHESYAKVIDGSEEFQTKISDSVVNHISNTLNELCRNKNITIIDVKHHSYCELYTFSNNEKQDRIQIFYDGKNKIKNIRSIDNNLPELLEEIKIKLHDTIVFITKEKSEEFLFSEPFLKDFYNNLLDKLNSLEIEIIEIKHNNYCERYTFKKNVEIAVIDFWYNGKKQFKKAPQHQQGSSIELVNEIYGLI